MYTENANRAHGHGMFELLSFQPFSKNPTISKVFREISLADELGSGMRNTYKYTKLYSGETPEFREGNVFKTMIPLTAVSVGKVGLSQNILVIDQVTDQVTDQVSSLGNGIEQEQDISQQILDFCQGERSKNEICELVLRQEKVQVKRELFFGTILTFPFLLISHGSVVL